MALLLFNKPLFCNTLIHSLYIIDRDLSVKSKARPRARKDSEDMVNAHCFYRSLSPIKLYHRANRSFYSAFMSTFHLP